jgi:hypothetical protein
MGWVGLAPAIAGIEVVIVASLYSFDSFNPVDPFFFKRRSSQIVNAPKRKNLFQYVYLVQYNSTPNCR